MASIGKVSAVFTASTSGLTSGVKAAENSFRGLGNSASALGPAIGGVSSRLNALIAIDVTRAFASIASSVLSAASSLVRFGLGQAEVVDQTSKLASRLGMTYGELSGLALAGELAGVSLDQIGAAATRADLAFVRAAGGSQSAIAAFNTLGLSVDQLAGLNAAGRFDAIASAIAALPTEAQRAAAAVQIFGRAGSELLPLFNGGAEAIREARAEAEAFGLSLTTAQGQDIEGMNDAFTRAQQAIAGVTQQVVAYLAPAVNAFVTQFSDFIASVGGANIGQAIGNGILTGARFLAGVADVIIQSVPAVWKYVQEVGQYWSGVLGIGSSVANLFFAAFKSLEVVGNALGFAFSKITSGLFSAAQNLALIVPGMTSMANSLGRSAGEWNMTARDYGNAMRENAAAAADAFGNAFGPGSGNDVGVAIAGPLTTAVDSAIAQAQASAAQIDEAKTAPVEIKQAVEVAGITEALKAVDSRSKEGVAEMFRLMRGDGGNVQEQQLSVLEQIADNTSGAEDIPALDLVGA
jgi:hypothetical protein